MKSVARRKKTPFYRGIQNKSLELHQPRYYRPQGGTTAPRYYRPPARYYRSFEGDVIPKGYGDLLPYPFSFFSPSPHSSRAPSQHPPRSAASVPSFEVLLRWDQSPPSSCAMDPGIASFLPRFGSTFLSLAVRAIRVDPLGFWLFLGTLRTWKDC